MIHIRAGAAVLLLALIGCGGSASSELPDRLSRPLFSGRGNQRIYILDAARSGVFVWNPLTRVYNTGRAATSNNPKRFIALPIGTQSRLARLDVLYSGFAVSATESAMAAAYSFGFGSRVGHLTVVPLVTVEPPGKLPVDPAKNLNFQVAADAAGPFATPKGQFLMVTPKLGDTAAWALYPLGVSRFTGPQATRVKWNAAGNRVYALSPGRREVAVLTWPAMQPVTTLTLTEVPIDFDLHPKTEQLALITPEQLRLYGALPTLAVEKSLSQVNFPYRVLYSRHSGGEALAVLNQNTTLSFFSTETLCGLDTDTQGFAASDLQFIDEGEFSNPEISAIGSRGCRSDTPNQTWQIIFQGVLRSGTAAATSSTGVRIAALDLDVQAGDSITIQGVETPVTAVTADVVYFAPVTVPIVADQKLKYELRASDWIVRGTASGYIGRAQTGHAFSDRIRFTIREGAAEPTRNDTFVFNGSSGITPIALSGVPSDLNEDPFGRMIVPVPDNGHARAVNIRKVKEGVWAIETLYIIP